MDNLYKQRAKVILKEQYWILFSITFFIGFLISIPELFDLLKEVFFTDSFYSFSWQDRIFFNIIELFYYLIMILLNIFIFPCLMVGVTRAHIESTYKNAEFFTPFRIFKDNWGNIVAVNFVTGIIVALWTFLFIIPGIIASYQYFFVSYLLADNPDMDGSRAREISKQMTDGEKLDIFLLDLSFIGWYLLGFLCCFIGICFVDPYKNTTFAVIYIEKRQQIIESGFAAAEEFRIEQESPLK